MRKVPFQIEAAAALIRESSTLATPLLVICLSAYGEEFFEKDPLEVIALLQEDFRADLTEEGENRLNAIRTALETDAFYIDPLAFQGIAKSLSSGDIGDLADGFEEEVTLPEALWAVYEVGLLRDDDIELAKPVLALFDQIMEGASREEGEGSSPEQFVYDNKIDLASQLQVIGVQFPLHNLHA
jgi:hypothetical protein